ncbi:CrcB family protein [Acidiferrobacter sp.]|uniref:fluoride efflux transporter FluC n=1 Tax=Acidiferrobacter sp. TaxID=1872107 RepID=UPI002616AF44|nr:CrcB family protein [Acidiferrobacter sp.]
MTFLWIACFAVLGAWLRYGQNLAVQHFFGRAFPWATLSINVIGSFLIGLLSYALVHEIPVSGALRAGVIVGGIGTYTTFSTFSLETLLLVEDGQVVRGLAYIVASLALGLGAVFLGALTAPHL